MGALFLEANQAEHRSHQAQLCSISLRLLWSMQPPCLEQQPEVLDAKELASRAQQEALALQAGGWVLDVFGWHLHYGGWMPDLGQEQYNNCNGYSLSWHAFSWVGLSLLWITANAV